MSKAKGYSPRLAPDLIPVLYRERRRRRIPMTVLASRLMPPREVRRRKGKRR